MAARDEVASTMTPKQKLQQRWLALKSERSTWLDHWRDIADHMRPRGWREFGADTNKGTRKHQNIINFTPLEAARTLASGMMAGITSPSRPWFRLTLRNEPALAENPAAKAWLSQVEVRLREAMAKSNIYKGLHQMYADLGPFGTTAGLVDEDDEDDVRMYVFPLGSYCLATSERGNVNAIFREVAMTVAQVVEKFGLEACTESTQRAFNANLLDQRVNVLHAVYPNPDSKPGVIAAKSKPFLSCWWEEQGGPEAGFLRESGYEEWPVMAPRWEVTGNDVYGHSPGMAALGDCRALQLLERRAAQGLDKVVNPPMVAPVSARNQKLSVLPGEFSFVDPLGATQAMRPAVDVPYQTVTVVEEKAREVERRIRKAFFADLWLLLSESQGQMTAREVAERREEKLLQLGTVLEALQDELLDPLITRIFAVMLRRGKIPPPPEELQGRELKVEYISIMAQAQKLLGTTGLERAAAFVGNLAGVKADVIDKLDFDQLVDEYADSLGVPPSVVRPDEAVAEMRAQREQQQAQAQAVEQQAVQADTAKKLSETDLENPSALAEMMRARGLR